MNNTHLLLLTVRFTQKQSNAEAHQIKLIEATVAFVKPVFRMTENSLDSEENAHSLIIFLFRDQLR